MTRSDLVESSLDMEEGRERHRSKQSGLLFSRFLDKFENVAVFEKLHLRCLFVLNLGSKDIFELYV